MRKIILLIFFLFTVSLSYCFKPDNEGFIKDWLIAGPFPNEGRWPICKGYFKDFLLNEGGEQNIEPYKNMSHNAVFVPSKMPPVMIQFQQGDMRTLGWDIKGEIKKEVSWKPISFSTSSNICNFKELKYFIDEFIIAYGACYIDMKEEKKLKLKIGSDDGLKIWINHKFIGEVHEHRAALEDNNVFEVTLNKGINLVVIKLEQDWSGWEMFFKFTDMSDKPYTNYDIYLTNPKYSVVDKVTKPEKINILDKDIAGYLSLGTRDDNVIFPGEIKGLLKLSAAIPVESVTVNITINDENRKTVFSTKNENLSLGPDKEIAMPFLMTFPFAGKFTFNAVVSGKLKSTKDIKEIGNLKRTIEIQDSSKIYEEYMRLLDTKEELLQSIAERDEEILNKNYVVDVKEDVIDKKNEKIGSLLKELSKYEEE